MRFLTSLVLSCVFSQTASAQSVPPGLQDTIVSLTTAIGSLQNTLGTTNVDISALTSSTTNIYQLGNSNFPEAKVSLAKASDALVVLANFSATVQHNVTPIALASVGVIASGIVLGSFAVLGIKHVFYALRGCWRLRHAPEIFLGH